MKKILLIVLVFVLSVSMAACGSDSSSESAGSDSAKEEKEAAAEAEEEVEEEELGPACEIGVPIVRSWINSVDSRWIQMIVPVKNTGSTNLYFSSCKIDLEDEEGHLIDSKDYISVFPQVIQPGEMAYYYEETTMDDMETTIANAIPHVKADEAKVDYQRFEVSDLDIKGNEWGEITVTGRVENTTDEAHSMFYVVAFFYNADKELLGIAYDLGMDEIAPGDKIGFSASSYSLPEDITLDMIDSYEVVAYPEQLQF